MNYTVGFIGCGNMAKAILGGIIESNLFKANQIMVSNRSEASLMEVQNKYSIQTTLNNKDVAKNADLLVLAVKPYLYQTVIKEIKDVVKDHVIIINIAAGVTLVDVEQFFGKPLKIVKAMPNTPSLVLEGMTAITPNHLVNKTELNDIVRLFNSIGKAEVVEEKLMDAVTAVSGSAPAYVYLFIEAMADAAVLEGMPRAQAYRFASQAVLGAAKMVQETGIHPGALKDQVCSPGGTTIEAVRTLEEKGLRHAVMAAMNNCSQKSKQMTKKDEK